MARKGTPGFSPARLKQALDCAGVTPARLADAANVSPAAVSKYLAGLAAPEPPRLAAIAAVLHVPIASLLTPAVTPALADLRAQAGLTQLQLAHQAGIHPKRYEAAEAGRRPLTSNDLYGLAAALGVPADLVLAAARK